MEEKPLLLVFVKNPVLGRVKTRLARTIGDAKALWVYEKLLERTRLAAVGLDVRKWVCYSDFVPAADPWLEGGFWAHQQAGADLGDRMFNAFHRGFTEGHCPVVIIGSDCPDLTTDLLAEAFRQLQTNPFVIGPAADGGYYLLGMTNPRESLFRQKTWSTAAVLPETLADLHQSGTPYHLLPVLSDVDEAADLAQFPELFTGGETDCP